MLLVRARLAFFGLLGLVVVAAGCSGSGGTGASAVPSRAVPAAMSQMPPQMVLGKEPSLSPASVRPGPMVQTPIQNPSTFAKSSASRQAQVAVVDPTWNTVTGGGTGITVSPTSPINCSGTTPGQGSIFVLSTDPAGPDKYIWEGDGRGNWCNIPGLASQISAAPNGVLYAVNSAGELYSWDGTSWTGIAGRATAVTAASDGTLYVLSNENGSGDEPIWHYTAGGPGTGWVWVPGSGVQIAANWDTKSYTEADSSTITAGGIYVLTSQGYIYHGVADGSAYVGLPGSASFIAPVVVQGGGGIYALAYPGSESGSSLWYYDLDNAAWRGIPGAGVSVAALSLNSGTTTSLWVIGSSGAIYTSAIASPAPTATPALIEAVSNGSFSTGDFTGWYNCYATRAGYTLPVNPSPAPASSGTQAAASPGPTPLDIFVKTTTPTNTAPPSGNTNFALVGSSTTGAGDPKALSGMCQNVTVPANGATLTFNVYEGGNDAFANADTEADVYSSTAFASTTNGVATTTAPVATLFAEDNCYDNIQNDAVYFSPPWGTYPSPAPVHTPNPAGRNATCPYFPAGVGTPSGAPGGGAVSLGGYWYSRTFDLSGYANQNVTLLFGIWRAAASANGTASTLGYYNYAYFDNIQLTGTP